MKIFLLSFLSFITMQFAANAQDTFSIVAVDTLTGEVGGSAGASCLDNSAIAGGAVIISDIIPGRGAIHTQSYWNPTNQANAHQKKCLMDFPPLRRLSTGSKIMMFKISQAYGSMVL